MEKIIFNSNIFLMHCKGVKKKWKMHKHIFRACFWLGCFLNLRGLPPQWLGSVRSAVIRVCVLCIVIVVMFKFRISYLNSRFSVTLYAVVVFYCLLKFFKEMSTSMHRLQPFFFFFFRTLVLEVWKLKFVTSCNYVYALMSVQADISGRNFHN